MAWESGSPTYRTASFSLSILITTFFKVRYFFKITKDEYLKDQPFLFYSNHHSFGLDAVMYGVAMRPVPIFVIAKATLFEMPVVSFFVSQFGGIPIHRSNDQTGSRTQNVELLNSYASNLELGRSLAIFPEGTCDNHLKIKRFRSGIGRIASRVVETKGSVNLKSAFLFYLDREHLFSEVRVVFLDGQTIQEQIKDNIFVKEIENKMRNAQHECYRPLKEFLNSISISADEEMLIHFHEKRSMKINYLIYLAENMSTRDIALGLTSLILYPLNFIFIPLAFSVVRLGRFLSIDRSELSTYKLGSLLALSPLYLFFLSFFIHFSILLPWTALAFVSLNLTAYKRKLIIKSLYRLNPNLMNQIITHWIVKLSK